MFSNYSKIKKDLKIQNKENLNEQDLNNISKITKLNIKKIEEFQIRFQKDHYVGESKDFNNLPVNEDAYRYTSAVVVSGKVVLASDQGSLFILDAETGRLEDKLSTKGAVTTAPIVANNTVYVINASGNLIAYR